MLRLIAAYIIAFNVALATYHHASANNIDSRIVGGNETVIFDFPYQVAIEYSPFYWCGGVIIGRTWVLTVAHCFDTLLNPVNVTVRYGTSYRLLGGQVVNASNVIIHSDYNQTTLDDDIALIQFDEPLSLSRAARIAYLPNDENSTYYGSTVNVTGWGDTSEGGVNSNVLRKIEVSILTQALCEDLTSNYDYPVTDKLFCAGIWEGGKDTCTGDAGSPVSLGSTVVGLASFGDGCGRANHPGVYVNIAKYRDWITDQTGI
ncbi:hypothetical protein NQ315_011547 [Exocentrus adspersus]|uniref:limulus clotting factor C n=1 Tax=Exocentrus adspersus TaxID=1586481 RepID=A0AAV8VVB6_9CUCU|nr:hypothetical protein NQ315_011547 [Exocentrus adspersus]